MDFPIDVLPTPILVLLALVRSKGGRYFVAVDRHTWRPHKADNLPFDAAS